MQRFTADSPASLAALAPQVLAAIGKRRVVLLNGNLGAGKTTLVSAIAAHLGSPTPVASPTYAIVNEYALPEGGAIYHFDLYRLKTPDEVFDIGFEDYLYSGDYCFVEWPAIAEPFLPEDACMVHIWQRNGSETRDITIG